VLRQHAQPAMVAPQLLAASTGRKVLVRIDGATHQVLDWLTAQRLSYPVGFGLPANTEKLAWTRTPPRAHRPPPSGPSDAPGAVQFGTRYGLWSQVRACVQPQPIRAGDTSRHHERRQGRS